MQNTLQCVMHFLPFFLFLYCSSLFLCPSLPRPPPHQLYRLPVLGGMQRRSCIWMQRWCQPLSEREGSKFISHWHHVYSPTDMQLICSETEANCFTALSCSYDTVNLTQLCYGIAKLEQISNSACFPASVNSSCFPSPTSPVVTR